MRANDVGTHGYGRGVGTDLIPLSLLTALTFALRVYHLASQSLWYDEAFSVYLAGMSLPEITSRTAADIHPPLYYYLLHFWIQLAGTSEFSVRFLSAFFGVLIVPLTYQLARQLVPGRGTAMQPATGAAAPPPSPMGVIAAILVASSPLYLWYSQEARMYTLLTALGVLTSQLTLVVLRVTPERAHSARSALAGWAVASIAAIYTHFYAFFLVAFQLLYVLWRASADRAVRSAAKRFGAAAAAVAMAYLPWLVTTLIRMGADTSYWEGPLNPAEVVVKTYLSFVAGHTAQASEETVIAAGYLALLVLGIATTVWQGWREPTVSPRPRAAVFLLLYLAVPAVLLFLISYNRPKFHPRYLMLASPAFYLLVANGITTLLPRCHPARRLTHVCATGALLVSAGFILAAASVPTVHYFRNEVLSRDDFRSVAGWIRERIQPGEVVILCSGHMFPAFQYYYDYPDVLRVPDQPTLSTRDVVTYAVADELNRAVAGRPGAWLVLWQDNVVDPDGILQAMLSEQGLPLPVPQTFWGIRVLHYALPPDAHFSSQPKPSTSLNFLFGDAVRLLGLNFGVGAVPSGGEAPLTLYWQALRPLADDYQVVLRLVDARGHQWGIYEGRPAAYEHPTFRWRPGEIVPGRLQLHVLPGTPPGQYDLTIELYPTATTQPLEIRAPDGSPLGQTRIIASLNVTLPAQPPDMGALQRSIPTWLHVRLAPEVLLLGHDTAAASVLPGDVMRLSLWWQALAGPTQDYGLALRLVDAQGRAASQQITPLTTQSYPTSAWHPLEVVRGQIDYLVRYDTAPGDWRLQAQLTLGGLSVGEPVILAPVHVGTRPPLPTPRAVSEPLQVSFVNGCELRGYAASRADGAVAVTLYWEASQPLDTSYTVFVHLLAPDGTIVSQHDGLPAGGAWPTTAWWPHQVIADTHMIPVGSAQSLDTLRVAVGLYDAVTGNRVKLTATDQDRLILGLLHLH